jgi:hypothetical protein
MYVYDLIEKKNIKVQITKLEQIEKSDLLNFQFEWVEESSFDVYKLEIIRTNEILGLMSIAKIFEELRVEIRLLELSKSNMGKDKRYQRVAGILIAHACKESFYSGFYGFVSLIPKTRLIDHYKREYGFKQYGKHLAVELESSERLMNKYLSNN